MNEDDEDNDDNGDNKVVHCCTLSLCYLGAETGYRVATPYSRGLNTNGPTEAKFDQFGPRFLQKVGFHMDSGKGFFFRGSNSLFWASKLAIFKGFVTFPELRAVFQN